MANNTIYLFNVVQEINSRLQSELADARISTAALQREKDQANDAMRSTVAAAATSSHKLEQRVANAETAMDAARAGQLRIQARDSCRCASERVYILYFAT